MSFALLFSPSPVPEATNLFLFIQKNDNRLASPFNLLYNSAGNQWTVSERVGLEASKLQTTGVKLLLFQMLYEQLRTILFYDSGICKTQYERDAAVFFNSWYFTYVSF